MRISKLCGYHLLTDVTFLLVEIDKRARIMITSAGANGYLQLEKKITSMFHSVLHQI